MIGATLSAFRVPPTNSLILTLTRPASRDPRAGPLGRHAISRHALFRVKGPLNAYGRGPPAGRSSGSPGADATEPPSTGRGGAILSSPTATPLRRSRTQAPVPRSQDNLELRPCRGHAGTRTIPGGQSPSTQICIQLPVAMLGQQPTGRCSWDPVFPLEILVRICEKDNRSFGHLRDRLLSLLVPRSPRWPPQHSQQSLKMS
jgi:hypothetical protein